MLALMGACMCGFRSLVGAVTLALGAAACAGPTPAARSPVDGSLLTASGRQITTAQLVEEADWNVLVFISRECPCVAAHDERLRDLATAFGSRGVKFVAIDSEVGGTPVTAAEFVRERQYPFPVMVDSGAALANELGAEYATFTVVLDRTGRVVYRGGIDSDKQKLHADATMYLRDALADLTAGRVPRQGDTTALGCALRKW